ncbi:MAG: CHAD domain-containing protein [Candidatus Poribacteria bacterium]|nr:CHAD domain-containing protein [Candidatus Poribacteria bacterium]MDE0503111.1 CHAD domain-containing protein [Candidatus Poribacteria bacterium]
MNLSVLDGRDGRKIIGDLADYHLLIQEQPKAKNVAIYDTFDWRLFEKSLLLYGAENELILHSLSDYKIVRRTKVDSLPGFAWEFPDGDLKSLLAPILEMRRLLKLTEFRSLFTIYRILNKEQKTVVKLFYEEICRVAQEQTLCVHLHVEPVRGYPRYYRKTVDRLEKMGFVQINPKTMYFDVLKESDKTPGEYSSKLRLQLEPNMRSDEATKIILRSLLRTMKANENYIIEDLDTEFLHDFRVAIRRTRIVLGQIKRVFPADTTKKFQRDFAILGKLSNELRDLDVCLLKENPYKKMVPESLREEINPLFLFLNDKRSKVLEDFKNSLCSAEYSKAVRKWEDFLNEPLAESPTAPNATVPISELARKRIHKRYTEILKTGAQPSETANDHRLHALRIECKKLRYLMEFFFSLFPRRKISRLIKELKSLQDNLGDFNDLCIQRAYLRKTVDELPISGHQAKKTTLAIGSLIGRLEEQTQTAKGSFSEIFTRFASPTNRGLYHELFVATKGKASP